MKKKLARSLIKDSKEVTENRNENGGKRDIELVRGVIDQIDSEIGEYLLLRQRLVDIIQEIKDEIDLDSKDPAREDEIKSFLISEYPEIEETIKSLYNHLFNQHE